MKKYVLICLLLLTVVSCTSPVEDYIKNDFARVVREVALVDEVQNEIDRVTVKLEELADEANPEAKQAKELKAKASKLEKEIKSRMDSYNRTGSYSYIINIAYDAEECDEMYAKAKRLEKKSKPYTNHKNKQIGTLSEAFRNVDAKSLMNSENLVKNDSVTVEYIFNQVIGKPANMSNLSEKEIEDIVVAYMTNYFIDNPTPTVSAYKFQKENDRWYITLSDEIQYFLLAIKQDNGEYAYQYVKTENPFSALVE